ncbi:MAG: threonine ammonia-lyase [Chthonomonadales bacterium]
MDGGEVVRPTVLVEADRLCERLGLAVTLAVEVFQPTGSFKIRAAYHLAQNVPHRRIITASSGNFGQALAYACRLLGKECTVVMPAESSAVKIAAVRSYGGTVELIDVAQVSRTQRVAELAAQDPNAYAASAYDDPLVIQGNSSLGRELAACKDRFDAVIVPVGGGGLAAGVIRGLREGGSHAEVVGAEPLAGNDAARSLRAGTIVANDAEPVTLADGARTLSVGRHPWEVLRRGLAGIVEVPEAEIARAVAMLFHDGNLKAEPTGALAVGALLADAGHFAGKRVCCVISGGNVDAQTYCRILADTQI